MTSSRPFRSAAAAILAFSAALPGLVAAQAANSPGSFKYSGSSMGAGFAGSLGWVAPTGTDSYKAAMDPVFQAQRQALETAFRGPKRTDTGLRTAVNLANVALARQDAQIRGGAAAAAQRAAADAAAAAAATAAAKARQAILPKSVLITTANPSVPAGQEIALNVAVVYADGSRRNLGIDPKVVSLGLPAKLVRVLPVSSISFGPSLKTLVPGSGLLCAQVHIDSFSGYDCTTLTVTAPALSELAVTPATSSLKLGGRLALAVSGGYTDGSVQPLLGIALQQMRWTVTPTNVATVDNSGVVSCRTGGGKIATIRAHSGYTPPWMLATLKGMSPPGLDGSATVTCK